jgi:predicted nucleic acid-binding protein
MKIRTYLDTNILITAFQGQDQRIIDRIYCILDDPEREFIGSDFLRLELLPKPTFYRKQSEIQFMQEFLDETENVTISDKITQKVIELAGHYDLQPMDALHISAATDAKVEEFITLENPDKPMCKIPENEIGLKVYSLRKS